MRDLLFILCIIVSYIAGYYLAKLMYGYVRPILYGIEPEFAKALILFFCILLLLMFTFSVHAATIDYGTPPAVASEITQFKK